jgi:hypothetical protein
MLRGQRMGIFLQPDEVNRLFDVIKEDPKSDAREDKRGIYSLKNTKIYRPRRESVEKFHRSYISPLIKSNQVVFDPKPGVTVAEDKIVVQSIDNYLLSRKLA